MKLWSGGALQFAGSTATHAHGITGIKTVELAIAYCTAEMQWIYEDIFTQMPNNITVKMTILSKCGNEAALPNFAQDPLVAQFEIIKLPNVGGCDYAYAHFIHA